jgi:monoamine oxidase
MLLHRLCERMAERLADRVVLGACVSHIRSDHDGVLAECDRMAVRARRAVVTLPPALSARIRYTPPLSAARDHLTQRTPMGWIIKVHCVYPDRFWAEDGLSGKVASDDGAVRAVADNSPPAGTPGILVGFIEGDQARRLGVGVRQAA